MKEGERGVGGGWGGASINAASGVWKKISPPSFINLQDIKAEQPPGGDEHAGACTDTPKNKQIDR